MRTLRVTLAAAGTVLLVFGAWLLLFDTRPGTVWPVMLWLAGVVAVHDVLLVPLVLLCGLALRGSSLRHTRGVCRGALITAGCLTLVALPAVLHAGAPRNPTVLPLDYPLNWLLSLAGTAVAACCVLLWRGPLRRGLRRLRKDRS